MREQHPICIFELNETQEPWDKGARYFIETVDGTCFYFTSLIGVGEFVRIHGLLPIESDDMATLRATLSDLGRDEPN